MGTMGLPPNGVAGFRGPVTIEDDHDDTDGDDKADEDHVSWAFLPPTRVLLC